MRLFAPHKSSLWGGLLLSAIVFNSAVATLTQCTYYLGQVSKAKAAHLIEVNGVPNGTVVVPPCGETPCDNPATTLSYLLPENKHLTEEKVIRYRVVNIANDDGSSPIIQTKQIFHQHEELVQAFKPYNITFDLDHMVIRNTTLRQTGILFGCDPSNIGDGICQPECVLYSTGNDGGDCDPKDAVCSTDMISDGVCQQVCNNAEHNYDGGDCCVMSPDDEPLCLDPSSPNRRRYMTIEDFKDFMKLPNDDRMNIMFAEWTNSYLIGLATFPWDTENSRGVRGGVVMKPREYGMPGKTATLVHEVGHIFGLWHVHHGISEVGCGDFCYEWRPSLTNGDLCSDTNPSPVHMLCSNPKPRSTCGRLQVFPHAPVSNFMSYSSDSCMDHFTPQQTARMHCHINRFYIDWRTDNSHRQTLQVYPISTEGRVILHWEEPFSLNSNSHAQEAGKLNGEREEEREKENSNDVYVIQREIVAETLDDSDDSDHQTHRPWPIRQQQQQNAAGTEHLALRGKAASLMQPQQRRNKADSVVTLKVRGPIYVDATVKPGQTVHYTVTQLSSAQKSSERHVRGYITVVVK